MVVFVETAWENWAFAGGRLLLRRVTGPAVTRRERACCLARRSHHD
jgi:hypothetical protein